MFQFFLTRKIEFLRVKNEFWSTCLGSTAYLPEPALPDAFPKIVLCEDILFGVAAHTTPHRVRDIDILLLGLLGVLPTTAGRMTRPEVLKIRKIYDDPTL